MNKIVKLVLFSVLLCPFYVNALCYNSDFTRYKALSSQISSYYEYDSSSNRFGLTFYNLSNDLRIVNKSSGAIYSVDSGIGNVFINDLSPGSSLSFYVYPKSGDCSDYSLRTIYINLPYYNEYYQDALCVNNSNALCSKWANTSGYSYEQFVKEVKKTKVDDDVVAPEPEPVVNKRSFLDFLGDYYIPILLFIIVSGSIGIYVLDKKSKFDF